MANLYSASSEPLTMTSLIAVLVAGAFEEFAPGAPEL